MSTVPARTAPVPSPESAPYWDGLKRHELLLQRCEDCGARQFYPRALCTACGGTRLAWTRASGRATLVSWSVVRRAVSEAYAADVPYALALVQLDEGPTLMSTLVAIALDAVRVGMALEVVYDDRPEGYTLPRFRPASRDAG
jgi:uncharacterized OB-fold protein